MALKVAAFVIRAGQTKHGPGRRQWGQREYAQGAISVLYPDGIPPAQAKAALVRAVRKQLDKDPVYRARGFKRIGRNTILRAAELFKLSN
jgi:hypothetical protein